MTKDQYFAIAIDGPVSAGKGTVSKLVAQKMSFLYIDTGAMYRVAGLLAIENNIDLSSEDEISEILEKSTIEMRNPNENESDGRLTTVIVNGKDVSWKIRTEEMGKAASKVATLKKVREVLVAKQQKIAKNQNVVMEGRDIAKRVLPSAQLKIYLTASELVRAKRRYLQYLTKGIDTSFEEVYEELLARDYQDSNRENDPLTIVPGAWVLDSSDLPIEKVVSAIIAKANSIRLTKS